MLDLLAHAAPPSHLALELPANPPAMTISLVDERPADGRIFVVWDSFGNFPEEAEPKTDPPQFLAAHAEAELVSPAHVPAPGRYAEKPFKGNATEAIAVRVLLSADLETAAGRKRIGVFTTGLDKPAASGSNEVPAVLARSRPRPSAAASSPR